MGLRQGKCTFQQVSDTKAPTDNATDETNQKEVSLKKTAVDVSQLENKPTEAQEQDLTNGDVSSKTEDKSGARRSSTKVVLKEWLKQRMPKKSFRKQSRTEPEPNNQSLAESENAESKAEECPQMVSVADNLVNDVISSAACIQAEAVMQEQTQKTTNSMVEGDHQSEMPVEDSVNVTEPDVTNESVDVQPKAEVYGDEDVVCDQVNQNNTNVFNEDAIAAKLANIELVNGQQAELANGKAHQNGYTNGHTETLVNGNHNLDDYVH